MSALNCVALTVDESIPKVELHHEGEKEKMGVHTIVLNVLWVVMVTGLVVRGVILTKKIHIA